MHSAFALTLTPLRLELNGNPGDTLTEKVTLINERKTAETFYTSYENFEAQGETGSPMWVDATDDIGTWMSTDTSVVLAPNQSKDVIIKIKIPQNAEAGGHFGGVFWGTTPSIQNAGQVQIGAKAGVLVLLSVSGNVSEKGGILEFATKNKQTFYTALPVDFYYRFANDGSDRIKPAGSVVIKDLVGLTATTVSGNPVEGNILPKSIRKIETSWYGADVPDPANPAPVRNFLDQAVYEWHNFGFGKYTANLSLVYGVKKETTSAKFSFWVLPWELLIVSFLTLIFSFLVIRVALRHYNSWVIGRAEKMFEEREAQMEHVQKKTVLHKVVGHREKKTKK